MLTPIRIALVVFLNFFSNEFVVAQQAPSLTSSKTFVAILERTGYIDLLPLKLSVDQQVALEVLLNEWEAATQDFEKNVKGDSSEWRKQNDPIIEQKLKAILSPEQLNWLIRERNVVQLSVDVNRNRRTNKAGSIIGLKQIQELLRLSPEQREKIKELDVKWAEKFKGLRVELAKIEDDMTKEYEKRLTQILNLDQKKIYSDLIGEAVTIVKPLSAEARATSDRIQPRQLPTIVLPPRDREGLSDAVIDTISTRLVFMVESKLEGDLELLPNQQEDWEAIRQDLEAAIEPHKLDQVLRNLDISVERLEWRSQTLSDRGSTTAIEKKSPSVSIAKARELTLAACDKAFNVLVDHQQHWLHQVALQYYVATSGGKFPLRFSWVRKKLDVTIDQNDRLNEVLQEHDKKLEESAVEFVQRFETLREEAEREFYDVLTLKQKNLLASYIGLPRSSSK